MCNKWSKQSYLAVQELNHYSTSGLLTVAIAMSKKWSKVCKYGKKNCQLMLSLCGQAALKTAVSFIHLVMMFFQNP